MSNIDVLKQIIEKFNETFSLEDIYCSYEDITGIRPSLNQKIAIKKTIEENYKDISFNSFLKKYELIRQDANYLRVSDMKYFEHNNRKIMKELFNQNVDSGSGFFTIKNTNPIEYAWFPKTNHKKWDNLLDEKNGLFKYKQKDSDISGEDSVKRKPETGNRFIFVEDNENGTLKRRFVGVYKFKEHDEDGYTIFEMVDDKIDLNQYTEKTEWLLSANPRKYDHVASFKENGYIEWRQNNYKYRNNDIVYIYSSEGVHRITAISTVVKTDIASENREIDDSKFWCDANNEEQNRFFKIKFEKEINDDRLSLENLMKHGLNKAPQGAQRITGELANYIHSIIKI